MINNGEDFEDQRKLGNCTFPEQTFPWLNNFMSRFRGNPKSTKTNENKELLADTLIERLKDSIKRIAYMDMDISYTTALEMVHELGYKKYKLVQTQLLSETHASKSSTQIMTRILIY